VVREFANGILKKTFKEIQSPLSQPLPALTNLELVAGHSPTMRGVFPAWRDLELQVRQESIQ